MIIRIQDITEDCTNFSSQVQMSPEQCADSGVEGLVDCKAAVTRLSETEFFVKVAYSCSVPSVCSRCATEFVREATGEFGVLARQRGSARSDEYSDESNDSEQIVWFDDELSEIDLSHVLYEEIVLTSELLPLCSTNCKGVEFLEKYTKDDEEEPAIDPRWQALAELKKKR